MQSDDNKVTNNNLEDFYEIKEEDFYPPVDNRVLKSNVLDIHGGDNFEEYTEEYNELTEYEEIYD